MIPSDGGIRKIPIKNDRKKHWIYTRILCNNSSLLAILLCFPHIHPDPEEILADIFAMPDVFNVIPDGFLNLMTECNYNG